MGKNKKQKFRAIDVHKLGEEDKKVTASTSRAAATPDGTEGHETVGDIPLPSGEPEQSPADCQTTPVQNKEDERQPGKVQFGFKTRNKPNQNDLPKLSGAWSRPSNETRNRRSGSGRQRSKERPKDTTVGSNTSFGPTICGGNEGQGQSRLNINAKAFDKPPNQNEPPQYNAWSARQNQSRNQRSAPMVHSKERPKDTTVNTTSGPTARGGNEGQGQSRLNINAKAFEPSSYGRTTQNWDSGTYDNSDVQLPLEPVQNFNQAASRTPQMDWPEAMEKEENQSLVEFKQTLEDITDQWSTATNLSDEQQQLDNNERSWGHDEHRESTGKNDDDDWRTGSRRKHGGSEADRSGGNRRSHDKRGSNDNRRSSPQSGYNNRKSYDRTRDSAPANSYGSGRGGEGATPTWGERGSSSERDSEFKEYCNLALSRDRPEFVKVKEIEGDLFAQKKEYSLAHCVAEDMGMGSGIAVQFRRDFKRVDELLNQRQRQGGLAFLDDGDRYIYYLVTKKVSNGKPTNHTVFCSLKKLRQHMLENGITKLAMPRIACGLDRLEWTHIKLMVEFLFRDVDVEIVVCNFQQEGDVPPQKIRRGRLVNHDKPIQDIEEGTIIIYTTSAEDHDTSQEMRELDKKFPSLLVQFRSSPRRPGMAIVYDKKTDYRLYGCVVRQKKSDPFDFVAFQKCIGAIEKENRKLCFCYVAFQAMTDPEDDLLNDKVVNIVRNGVRGVDVYVCPIPE